MTGQLAPEDVAGHVREPFGPSSKSICKVTTGNVCGSGSLVGERNGRSLVLTNAHVAGTRIGKRCNCTFPDLNNRVVPGAIVMAGYSDRILMDWAVLELDRKVPLPHVKLSIDVPSGEHYTGGYPRCRGPFYQKLITQRISHGGTVWRWQPNSIGGQSGSAVHSFADHLQRGLLTWSWGGDGAGQTCRSIWSQYVRRQAFGVPKPDGLVELGDRLPPEELEQGFFSQTNVTTLPIWAHLDEDEEPGDPEPNPELARRVLEIAEEQQSKAEKLAELARRYMPEDESEGDSGSPGGGIFGI